MNIFKKAGAAFIGWLLSWTVMPIRARCIAKARARSLFRARTIISSLLSEEGCFDWEDLLEDLRHIMEHYGISREELGIPQELSSFSLQELGSFSGARAEERYDGGRKETMARMEENLHNVSHGHERHLRHIGLPPRKADA
jgi:hypothetical protein